LICFVVQGGYVAIEMDGNGQVQLSIEDKVPPVPPPHAQPVEMEPGPSVDEEAELLDNAAV